MAAPRRVEVASQAPAEPGPGQIRIALEGSGLCGSEIPVWEGRPWFEYPQSPGAPGHEGWGTIDALGEGVDGLTVGQRVTALSYRAHATYDVADVHSVVGLPAALGDRPFPGEALACAINVFHRTEVRAGEVVAIVGIGFLGALLTQLISRAGATVIAITRRKYALEVARSMGAAHTIALGDGDAVVRRVEELTGSALCDRVVEVTGKQQPLDVAGRVTRVRGRLVIAGFHQDGPRSVDMQLWNWRGLDVINAHERDPGVYVRGMREAVVAVVEGRLDPDPLYTHLFPLDAAAAAFDAATARPDGFMKALLVT
ncbi:MAG: zinc-binding dehydrogenase [Actinomycetota bacterium]|nr:zinc-binding dehydrogenase [Actinomycetota bacterium]